VRKIKTFTKSDCFNIQYLPDQADESAKEKRKKMMQRNILYLTIAALSGAVACDQAPGTLGQTRETMTCFAQRNGDNLSAIQLIVQGDSVSGYIAQNIGDKPGAAGFFNGVKQGERITADYTFYMDNALQTHEIVLKLNGGNLYQGAGSMILENDKMTLRDKNALQWMGPLVKTGCTEIEDAIDRARQIANSIRKSG
jgi:hypothetical protein